MREPVIYEIQVEGQLDGRWSDWFEGLAVRQEASDETILCGPIADQAALHGILRKIRDLGLPLISLRRLDDGPSV